MLDDALRVLDAAYRFDLPERPWLTGIVNEIHAAFARGPIAEQRAGFGAMAFAYDIDRADRLHLGSTVAMDVSDRFADVMSQVPTTLPPSYVRGTFGRVLCSLASRAGGRQEQERTRQEIAEHADIGWRDVFVLNALDPTDHGLWVGLPLAEAASVPAEMFDCWTKVAVHLAAAIRLRRRLHGGSAMDDAEAVLDPRGSVAHASGPAATGAARQRLSEAAREIERLRAAAGHRTTGRALHHWKGLVDARWTIVDHFESDGKRYLVAQRNDVPIQDMSRLTERERQVLAFASLGHPNKLIAYELGLAPSTVGVFLHHAAKKLGARSRKDLIARFRALSVARDRAPE